MGDGAYPSRAARSSLDTGPTSHATFRVGRPHVLSRYGERGKWPPCEEPAVALAKRQATGMRGTTAIMGIERQPDIPRITDTAATRPAPPARGAVSLTGQGRRRRRQKIREAKSSDRASGGGERR